MLHARKDYNRRVQDSENKIGEEEPVFLLRGQDDLMVPMLYHYLKLLHEASDYNRETEKGVLRHIERTVNWQDNSLTIMKQPDTPQEEVL